MVRVCDAPRRLQTCVARTRVNEVERIHGIGDSIGRSNLHQFQNAPRMGQEPCIDQKRWILWLRKAYYGRNQRLITPNKTEHGREFGWSPFFISAKSSSLRTKPRKNRQFDLIVLPKLRIE